jgi:hypothetical protein
MKMPCIRRITVVASLSLLVISALATSVLADDLNPPPWRGQPGTTFAEWEFLTPNPNPPPDIYVNPFGAPEMSAIPGALQSWQAEWDGRMGVWPLSGTMMVGISNYPIANPFKDIWIQLTWEAQAIGNRPTVWETITGAPATLLSETPIGGSWLLTTYLIHLIPNPQFEIVRIDGGIMVDELVIDTICVPEPGTTALFALGGLLLLRRRR